ncbi:MAG: hypothetical protein AB7E31_15950 [Desulfitobacterium sp.]
MPKCEKCGVEVPQDDLYIDNGLKVCEGCKVDGIKRPELKIDYKILGHDYFH